MKIELEEIVISNEGFDNDSFVEIIIKEEAGENPTISVDELYCAAEAFKNCREIRLKTDQWRR